MVTIIYGHPHAGSFNHAILETVLAKLYEKGVSANLIDLYADNFDPAIREADLELYSAGLTTDSLSQKYMSLLGRTNVAIFVYPVWWGTEPAIIKGFYDNVLLKGFAWSYSEDGKLVPLLHIKKTIIFTTSEAPCAFFAPYFEKYLPEHVFNEVGMYDVSWHNLDSVTSADGTGRKRFLELVESVVETGI